MQNTVDESEVKIPGDVVFVLDHLNQQTTTTAAQIRNHTRRDPTLAKVLQHVQSGWPEGSFPTPVKPYTNRKLELSVDSGCVLWGARVIITTSLHSVVLNELHEVHTGVVRMKSLAHSFVWWPNLDHDIEQVVKECNVCQHHHHHHSCRSHATKTAFISGTTLRCLSIHLAVAPEISTSWYQYPFSLGFS